MSNTYVVAVSGGVDSVVLLDLVSLWCKKQTQVDLVVAHFDHGIREDSHKDAEFVGELAQKYNLTFELGTAQLGADASEHQAREARYRFLRSVKEKHQAKSIMTAHHQDDVIETALINIIRGTGWRGLISLRSSDEVVRPLLDMPKQTLVTYARQNNLVWHDDSTNVDQNYLRNYLRHTLIPAATVKDAQFASKMVDLIDRIRRLQPEIMESLESLLSKDNLFSRYQLIMWPETVAKEVIYQTLVQLDPLWHPNKHQITRILHFIKTARPKKQLDISKHLKVVAQKHDVQFKKV